MKHKFFAIPARNSDSEETAFNHFCAQQRVTFVEKHLIPDGAQSFWSICVTYDDESQRAGSHIKDARKPRVDYKKVLGEKDFNRYLQLHALRKALAEQYAVPAYAIFTNEQLATMVQQRVTTKANLEAIDNIGQKRIDLYGEAFLQTLNTLWQETCSEASDEKAQDNS